MNYEELQRYIIERLLEFDPTISDAEGSRAWTVIVDPIISRLGTDPMSVDTRTFIKQRIREELPNLDVDSPGSPFVDAFVNALQLILEPYRRETEFARTNKSLNDIDLMTEEEVDAILANVLVTRNLGETATTTVRVYYSSPRSVSIDSSIVFSTSDGVGFVAVTPTSYLPRDMRRSAGEYYIDVAVESKERTALANVDKNQIRFVSGLEGVLRVTNPLPVTSPGASPETNEAVIARARTNIGERSLNTERGIVSAIQGAFNDVSSVDVVGFGEPDMRRDILTVESVTQGGSSVEEEPGRLVFLTQDFKTLPLLDTSYVELPASNTLRLVSPASDKVTSIKNARFVRVLDVNAYYLDDVVARVRPISKVLEDGSDLILVLGDTEVSPAKLGDTSYSPAVPIKTSDAAQRYNKFAKQGTAGSMLVTELGIEYVVAAPLPVTDLVYVSGVVDGTYRAEIGRDFLLTYCRDERFNNGVTPLFEMPDVMRMYPVVGPATLGSYLRVGRADGLLVSKSRYGYGGGADYEYAPNMSTAAANDGIYVFAHGGPAFDLLSGSGRYDGTSLGARSSRPGVTIQVLDKDGSSFSGSYATELDVEVTLNSSYGVTWESLGVTANNGEFISLALFDNTFSGAASAELDHLMWNAWGKVSYVEPSDPYTLRVVGLDVSALDVLDTAAELNGFDKVTGTFASPEYRIAWSVYQGELELITVDGTSQISYADLVFPPCYMPSIGATGAVQPLCEVGAVGSEGFQGSEGFVHSDASRGYAYGNSSVDARVIYTIGHTMRLARSLFDVDPGYGEVGGALLQTALIYDLDAVDVLVGDDAVAAAYLKTRYATELGSSVTIRASAPTSVDIVRQAVVLPIVDGDVAISSETEDASSLVVTLPAADKVNTKSVSGHVLPHPMGAAHLSDPTYASEMVGSDTLNNQILQLFEARDAAPVEGSDYTITLGGLPGGVPFPDTFDGTVDLSANEVHVGGMSDIYIQASTNVNNTMTPFPALPDDIELSAGELVFSGTDGVVDIATPGEVGSLSLSGFVRAFVGSSDTYVGAGDLTLEFLNLPDTVSPAVFKLANTSATGVALVGALSGLSGSLSSLRYRVYTEATTSLASPKRVLQAGGNASTSVGSDEVTVGSIEFTEDVTQQEVFFELLSGNSLGVYRILAVGVGATLTLDRAVDATGSGLYYRIFTLQALGADLPVIRVSDVLAVTDTGDSPVPLRDCLEARASSFAGLNDDPIDGDSATVTYDGTTVLLEDTTADFVNDGVLAYDAVVLEGVAEDDKYYYVLSLTATTLTLGGAVPSFAEKTGVPYIVGHPAVGTVSLSFKDRTYCRVDQETSFFYDRDDGLRVKFRPSPLESADVFKSSRTSSDVLVEESGGIYSFRSEAINFLEHEVQVGDLLYPEHLVLQSDIILAANYSSLALAGRTLLFTVNNQARPVTFSGVDPLSLDDVVSDINRSLSDVITAAVVADGANFRLELYSTEDLAIAEAGSTAGVLSALELQASSNVVPSSTDGPYEITALTFDSAYTTITVSGSAAALLGKKVFIRVSRPGVQHIFPADMVEDSLGLYTAVFRLTAYPVFRDDTVERGQALQVEGLYTLGYTEETNNTNGSYSTVEDPRINCTSHYLPSTAEDFSQAIALVGANLRVSYDTASVVGSVQDYVLRSDARVLCSDPLVRNYFPAYPMMLIRYRSEVPVSQIEQALSEFITTLYPNRPLEAYDVMSVMTRLGVEYVDGDLEVAFLKHDEDRGWSVSRSTDFVTLNKRYHVVGNMQWVAIEQI